MLRSLIIIILIAVGLLFIGWLGFQIQPAHYQTDQRPDIHNTGSIKLPDSIPSSFNKYLHKISDEPLKNTKTAIVWGRARLKIAGIWVPARFKAFYAEGKNFYRQMEVTWFGRPVIKGVDSFIKGKGTFQMGNQERKGMYVSRGQKLTMMTEMVWTPAAYLHNPEISWNEKKEEPNTSQLLIPFQDTLHKLNVKINPHTHVIDMIYGERSQGPDGNKKVWQVKYEQWKKFNDILIPAKLSVTWKENPEPWSVFYVEGVKYNKDISDIIPYDESI